MVVPVADVEAVVGELVARVAGFGPLQPFPDDPMVEEIRINDPGLGLARRVRLAGTDGVVLGLRRVRCAETSDRSGARGLSRRPAVRLVAATWLIQLTA